jgi:hypothetical protein
MSGLASASFERAYHKNASKAAITGETSPKSDRHGGMAGGPIGSVDLAGAWGRVTILKILEKKIMPEWNNLGSTVFHLLSALICPPARARCPSPAPAPPCAGLFLPILSLVRSCKGGDPAPPGRSHHVNIAPSNAPDQRGETENRLHDAEIAPGHGFDVGLLGGARFELSPKAPRATRPADP